MKFSVVGDIMLSRLIGQKFDKTSYTILENDVLNILRKSDYIIANLESPIVKDILENSDHLVFNAKSKALEQFSFVNFFSLANNHINDCGIDGMENTMSVLDDFNIAHNGVYSGSYKPHCFTFNNQKFAIFTCTDMMNNRINHHYKVPDVNDSFLIKSLNYYRSQGYINIMYAHMGQLFTRYPNPIIRRYARHYCDAGADIVLTVHPHVLGGVEEYKGKKIIYSLGDFVMDGSSNRRRRSCIMNFEYSNLEKKFTNFEMIPTFVNKELNTILAPIGQKKLAEQSWKYISNKLNSLDFSNYSKSYKSLYKKEIVLHNLSTLYYLLKTKGVFGLSRLLIKRINEVKMMLKWLIKDRSMLTKDDDAILEDRKKFSSKDLFK